MNRTPFVTSGYARPEYFCGRQEETATIVRMLTNQNNLAIMSPRRMGKTDLIRHCFCQPEIRDNYYTFEVDIYATGPLHDFVDALGQAVLRTLRPLDRKAWEGFLQVLASLRSGISFDINGQPVWGFGIGSHGHLMSAIFVTPSRPFYQSVTPISLPPIALDKYNLH